MSSKIQKLTKMGNNYDKTKIRIREKIIFISANILGIDGLNGLKKSPTKFFQKYCKENTQKRNTMDRK